VAKPRPEVQQAEQALERLFRLTANRKVHRRQTTAVGVDITRAGYAVLRSIDASGELTLGEVAAECSMDPAAASRQVHTLEADGLVRRNGSDGDGRVTVLRLTDEGRDVYRRIVEVRTAYMERVLADWTVADRAELAKLVNRLVDDLKTVPFRPTNRS
jgi:DNA-binding MarR family transcriptional regulator